MALKDAVNNDRTLHIALMRDSAQKSYIVALFGPATCNDPLVVAVSEDEAYASDMYDTFVTQLISDTLPDTVTDYPEMLEGPAVPVALQKKAARNPITIDAKYFDTPVAVTELLQRLTPHMQPHPVRSLMLALAGKTEEVIAAEMNRHTLDEIKAMLSDPAKTQYIISFDGHGAKMYTEQYPPFLWVSNGKINVLNPDFYVGEVPKGVQIMAEWARSLQ